MNWQRAILAAFGFLVLAGCTHAPPAAPVEAAAPVVAVAAPAQRVLLIGLDGFRPEMLGWDAPNLAVLAARGVKAEAMIPVMPSVTFVNF